MKKTFILILTVAMTMTGCKDGKQTNVVEGQEAAETAEAEVAKESVKEPVYDLEAIAQAIKDCDYLENFHNGVAGFRKKGVWSYVDRMGRLVEGEPESEEEGLVPDYLEGKKGFKNSKGELVIDHKYQYAGNFHEGLCWIYLEDGDNEGIGYINEKDEIVIPCQYEWAVDHEPGDFHEGVCPVMTVPDRELFSYIDKTGALAFPGVFSSSSNFSEGLARAREILMEGDDVVGIRNGYIDKTGTIIIPLEENMTGGEFHEGIARVYDYMTHDAWLIDREGNKLFKLDPEKFYVGDDFKFSEGLCAFCGRDAKWRFMDKTGRMTSVLEGPAEQP